MTAPRLPSYLHGTSEICAHLEAIGIRVQFPYVLAHVKSGSLASSRHGKVVAVSAQQFRAWVGVLTGRTYDRWVAYWESRGRPPALWTPKEANRNPVIGYADGLVTLLEPDDAIGESVVRLENGATFVTLESAMAEKWHASYRHAPRRAVRWRRPRMAEMRALGRRSGEPGAPSTAFVTVLLMRDALLRFVSVPSSLFGSPLRTSTIAAAPQQQPRWKEIADYVSHHFPDAMWVAWTEREELDLETMRPPGETIEAPTETEAQPDG